VEDEHVDQENLDQASPAVHGHHVLLLVLVDGGVAAEPLDRVQLPSGSVAMLFLRSKSFQQGLIMTVMIMMISLMISLMILIITRGAPQWQGAWRGKFEFAGLSSCTYLVWICHSLYKDLVRLGFGDIIWELYTAAEVHFAIVAH